MLEIERTYLVKNPPNLKKYKRIKIKQGYISRTGQPLRVRSIGDKYELTKKVRPNKKDLTTAEEMTIPLTRIEFNKLWTLVETFLLKTRYYVPLNKTLIAELDIFDGQLKGLAFVEVEFTSREMMDFFTPPDWFGPDVTNEQFSSNAFLAGKSFCELSLDKKAIPIAGYKSTHV